MRRKRKPTEPVFKEYTQDQMWLLPPSLEELIPTNHLVRTVNAAIDGMDIRPLVKSYKGGGTSSYHPRMLLKVLIYAYTQKIYTSRKIAKALREDITFMWLAGNNRPDFRTINRFRAVVLKEGIGAVFSGVLELLIEKGLIRYENYFLDGTKIEADANKYSYVWKKTVKRNKERVCEQVNELLERIEKWNEEEDACYGDRDLEELGEGVEIGSEELQRTIDTINQGLAERRSSEHKEVSKVVKKLEKEMLPWLKRYEGYERILGKRNSFSKTDADATFMRTKDDVMGNGQLKACYNVQIGTENQYILGYSIHQTPSDTSTLIPHMNTFQSMTGRMPHNIIADAGYGSEENYEYIQHHGIGNYVKYNTYEQEQKRGYKDDKFRVEHLEYDSKKDEYICPAGRRLRYTNDKIRITDNGYVQRIKVYSADDCRWCRQKSVCHRSKKNRTITINPTLVQYKSQVIGNLKSEKGLLLRARRGVEVETVFGHIKRNWEFKRFRLRGRDKVATEWGILCIAYNLFKLNMAIA